ncbi:MAG TPA: RluA family pseudouridine synthase [Terriglobia bacterium]|nr:RluA family pseudouridine synthase [Terriglobia bacterium]
MDTKTDRQHSEETREIVADAGDAGERLDVFLASRLPEVSRSRLRRLIQAGCVETGGRVAAKAGETVAAGDSVRVRLAREEMRALPENLPVEIVYEDSDLVVVNKSAGMVVHIGAGIHSGTLVNALLYHIRQLSSAAGDERPGIVHRLDKMTSGLMLVAKNDAAHRVLAAAFKARAIKKTYTTLVHGRVKQDAGSVDAPVGRDPRHRYRMKVGGVKGREALTEFAVLRRFQDFTLLSAMPRTGRTHQIRVHLASLGHPVAGDTAYGAPAKIRLNGQERKTLSRTFLHASALEFAHPSTGKPLAFAAPLPAELAAFLDKLTQAK